MGEEKIKKIRMDRQFFRNLYDVRKREIENIKGYKK